MIQTCEKKLENQATCNQAAFHGVPDSNGNYHYFCEDHLWDQLPATNEEKRSKTCEVLGANPPSLEACGRPAAFKRVGPFGETKYWCARCRRKHWPTKEEKTQDEEKGKRPVPTVFTAIAYPEMMDLWTQ